MLDFQGYYPALSRSLNFQERIQDFAGLFREAWKPCFMKDTLIKMTSSYLINMPSGFYPIYLPYLVGAACAQ